MPRRRKEAVLSRAEIGQRLKALRKERGMTQVDLAEAVGTHQTSLSQIERGIRGVGLRQILKLSKALGTSPDKLLRPSHPTTGPSRNEKLLRRVRQIESLPSEHQEAVVKMLDAFLDTQGSGRR